ncbi:2-dehydro-3-deoxyphosphogluconate aldolase/4- hydroxy-2-oxoglutarate aldolase [Kribbella flavida DSM 17836]|uniref:2-dehydro-3-deoxyphosphogluconate aldolase/4-hydroxy-2-oxoglutarate aldolase n=1 Tax=Kribbella flavida (strain DSM 17836 / JCM 10339 / NBRC 14399) TaxID=479435 RepID=D2Q236_KRIFD|nr:bifunctional 4-hydroxy-2-oxoglutarate aldolase/2-dehydro-3-deoxy-phosphogluconate aldolase [Kribbella flavida]ADB33982.1 2-dehydro-3-deoxyphosphogluconate aldolase/4- hydroxy-2-oxoglutarate aldolase [Kribbella flavida DSM 17836]
MIRLRDELGQRPVVAVLRAPDAGRFVEVSAVLVAHGFGAVEFTLTSAGAVEAIARAAAELPSVLVGAGTVRTVEQVHQAIDAGAGFLVSQVTSPVLVEAAHARGVPFVPGALTPNEIVAAWELGVQAVKVSPIGPVGGARYIAELAGPLPEIPLMPTGAVPVDAAGEYLAAGATVVGLSRDLTRDALGPGGDLDALADRAARVIRSVDRQLIGSNQ